MCWRACHLGVSGEGLKAGLPAVARLAGPLAWHARRHADATPTPRRRSTATQRRRHADDIPTPRPSHADATPRQRHADATPTPRRRHGPRHGPRQADARPMPRQYHIYYINIILYTIHYILYIIYYILYILCTVYYSSYIIICICIYIYIFIYLFYIAPYAICFLLHMVFDSCTFWCIFWQHTLNPFL